MHRSASVIELQGVHKQFGDLVALDDLSMTIGAGEVFGFIGPNGAGKSTTMKILCGLLQPDRGSARVCGVDALKDQQQVRRLLGYMPDVLGVYHDLTVDEYLQFFAGAFELPRMRRRATIDGVLQLTDLGGKRDAMVSSLSRGMTQRLGVARVLLHDPKVLLLDEPASGLDPRARIELRELLLELKRMGKTIMVSSHILTELGEVSSSIGIIERGKLLFAGSVEAAIGRSGVGHRVVVELEPVGVVGGEGSKINASQAALELQRDPRVLQVSVEGDRLVLTIDQQQRSHHFLIEKLMGLGARIGSIAAQPVKLEEVFLRLTRGVVN
jgi:ABC-2 type transport system ATP-binding protein